VNHQSQPPKIGKYVHGAYPRTPLGAKDSGFPRPFFLGIKMKQGESFSCRRHPIFCFIGRKSGTLNEPHIPAKFQKSGQTRPSIVGSNFGIEFELKFLCLKRCSDIIVTKFSVKVSARSFQRRVISPRKETEILS
jgi:hypothetical protein